MKEISFNNNKAIIVLLVIASLTVSCKKLIEIPPNPPTAITEAQQFADSTTAMTAIAGIYSYAGDTGTGFAYDDGMLTKYTGLSSDELSLTITGADPSTSQFYTYGLTSLNGYISSLWSRPFSNIYAVNAILSGVSASNGLSASFKKQVTAEMKVVRAFYYFNLVNLYGAVPLVLSTDYKQTAHIARTPVDLIYKQAIADLNDAGKDLTANYPSPGRARPNLYTALTLLAKIHLYQGQWQDAYNETDAVIRSGVYSLEPDLNNVFLDGSNEAIWQLPANGPYEVTAEAYSFIPWDSSTIPSFLLTPFLLNAFETGDERLQKWVGTTVVNVDGTDQTFYYPYKYKNMFVDSAPTEDYMIFRLGELYLIRAEAAAHLGKLDDALADIDIVRARAGLPASTANASSQADVLNAIMHERQVDLFTEWGSRWFDLKRTGMAGAVLGTEKTGWQNNAALYPIPLAQLELDNLLKQNPGY